MTKHHIFELSENQEYMKSHQLIHWMSKVSSCSPVSSNLGRASIDSMDCLDLSIREVFMIIHFAESDPGAEYEMVSQKDLADTWESLYTGARVSLKFGTAKVQGVIIALSEDMNDLRCNFKRITDAHREDIMEKKLRKALREQREALTERPPSQSTTDRATQTPNESSDYWKQKYDELKSSMTAACSEVVETMNGLLKSHRPTNNNNYKRTSSSSSTSSPGSDRESSVRSSDNENDEFNVMVQIGSLGTKVPKTVFDNINWSSYTGATRKLLITIFPREVLATHSLTGKPSPAFLSSDKLKKIQLNPTIIADIIEIICKKCKVSESLVRNAITTKCADENKLYRRRLEKQNSSMEESPESKRLKTEKPVLRF